MRKTLLATLIALLAVSLAAAGRPNVEDRDIQVIKKAVKENAAYQPGQEVKWLKVLVVDAKTKKDRVKITLPISVVEALIRCSDDHHLRIHDEDCEIDLKALLAELKKAGPMALIEVCEDGGLVKVWLE
ncbi:MAG: hypothetical protein OEW05_09045 [Candidatus Aminicenantes bacterium]|nr:hypothetical protein [Candidatus Aminicenantes bacterium]